MKITGAGQSLRLLVSGVDVLALVGIEYAVVGAVAAAAHGVVRASLDADALVAVSAPQLKALQAKLERQGYICELRRGDLDDPIPALLCVSDEHGNRVDLLAGIRGLDSGAYARATTLRFENSSLRLIGREDFIAMKLFAGGPQDLLDAQHAFAVSKEQLDLNLLMRLSAAFGKEAKQACERLLQGA